MTSMPSAAASAPSSPPRTDFRRAGGLRLVGRGEMTPVFTLLVGLTFFDVLAFLAFPYLATRHLDSPWQDPSRLAFLGASILSSLVFGLLAGVSAERRCHDPLWFLAGHLGAFAAPVLAMGGFVESSPVLARTIVFGLGALGTILALAWFRTHPRTEPVPTGPILRALGKFFHASGNLWFGIGLLVLLTVGVFIGGWWETYYGGKSARYCVYTSPAFGILFLGFALSLVCATLRKFPFRVDQAGWLTVHSALVMMIIGAFMSYWGKEEGQLSLGEGESTSQFTLDTQTRLRVDEVVSGPDGRARLELVQESIAPFDVNPLTTEPNFVVPVSKGGTKLFDLRVERYFADARPKSGVANDGPRERLGVRAEFSAPRAPVAQEFFVDEQTTGQTIAGMLDVDVRRAPTPEAYSALLSGRDRQGHGRLVVRSKEGKVLLEQPVLPQPRPAGAEMAPARLDVEVAIPETEGLKLLAAVYFDNLRLQQGMTRPFDISPGRPFGPAVGLAIKGPMGDDVRFVEAWYPGSPRQISQRFYDLDIVYEFYTVPERAILFLPHPQGGVTWIFQPSGDEKPRTGPAVPGQELALGIPLRIRTLETFDRLRTWNDFEFVGYNPENQVIRVGVTGDDQPSSDPRWLRLAAGTQTVTKGGRDYVVRWQPTMVDLGFQLKLHDFHRDFYPGSDQERTFESYLRLVHPSKFKEGVDIKIDMNNPLRLDGLRLYQSRFSTAEGEMTVLQVNRDPGLGLLYVASALLVLGFVVVSFQKPFLRSLGRWLDRRGAAPGTRIAAALGAILLSFAGVLPGLLVIMLLPPGPAKGIGVAVIVAGLVLESLWVHFTLRPRLDPVAATPRPATAGVGVTP